MSTLLSHKKTGTRDIPKEWGLVRLGEVISLKYGKGLSEKKRTTGPFPVVGSNGIIGYHNQSLIQGPGIVVGRKGSIGSVSWVDLDFWPIDTTYYVAVLRQDVDLRWLYFSLLKLNLQRLGQADVVPGLRRELVHILMFPFPPLTEQKKIADILWTVDETIQKVGQAIEKTQKLKEGLMQQLLTKGIGHREFNKTDSGMIPKTWELKRLKEISVDFVSGGTPSTSKDEYWNGDIPWMTSAFITEREVKTGQRFITSEGLKKSATKIVPKNNLLVATRVGIGKAAVNRIDIAISQDLTGVIIDNNKAIPDFLYWHIVNDEKRLKSMAQGSTIKGILREDLQKISLPLPPLPEQQKIAEILSSVDKRIETLRKRKERLEKVKKGLMEDLLTGKKRVKLED
ncbi:MAG: restriction endonuclease subunit S [Candidatus Saccharicenans sp.]|jgi:type I restriction enzyme S subunit|nr:restriction endonuclease subunit S [Candidatus Saccharicenans sp.]